jgi:hypothetical protein
VLTRERRTKIDGAECVREVLDRHSPDVETVVILMWRRSYWSWTT